MKHLFLYSAWLVSAIATAGSLYFSNVMMLPPCSLCWWQRIGMFPLFLLFTIAFVRNDKDIVWYSTPLIIIGWIISVYHNLLYYGLIEKSITACSAGVSCTSKTIEWFGLLTIPLLSLTAYSLLILLTSIEIFKRINQNEKRS